MKRTIAFPEIFSGAQMSSFCSAWLRLKLNNEIGLNHHTPPLPTTRDKKVFYPGIQPMSNLAANYWLVQ